VQRLSKPVRVNSGERVKQTVQTGPITLDQLTAARDALLQQASGPMEIETPLIGRVMFRSAADISAGLGILNSQIAAMSGKPVIGTFVVVSDRGLGGCK
jgi:hypothetical protein